MTADVFWARLGATSQDLSGIYTTWAPASSAFAADVYGLYLRGADDDQRVMTLGTRVKVTPGAGITAKGEVAHQSGKTGDLDVSAYAVHGEVGAAIPMAAKPGVEVGFDMASGDTDPTDDKNETFNNLFPTNHLHYGHLDLASWKNLQDIYAGVSMKPTPGLKVYARVHMLSRKTTEDTAYVASGKPLAALDVASATDESDLGQEVDVVAIWKVTPGLKLLGGWSYMKVGPFLEAVDPDGDDNRNFTYLQLAGGF